MARKKFLDRSERDLLSGAYLTKMTYGKGVSEVKQDKKKGKRYVWAAAGRGGFHSPEENLKAQLQKKIDNAILSGPVIHKTQEGPQNLDKEAQDRFKAAFLCRKYCREHNKLNHYYFHMRHRELKPHECDEIFRLVETVKVRLAKSGKKP